MTASRDVIGRRIQALLDADPSVREEAAMALYELASDLAIRTEYGDLLAQRLATALQDADTYVREQAALALGNLGTAAQVVVPALLIALSDENQQVREAIAGLMEELDCTSISSERLSRQLADMSMHVRLSIAWVFWKVERDADRISSILASGLGDEDSLVRAHAARIVVNIGRDAESLLPLLLSLHRDPFELVRLQVLRAIKRFGMVREQEAIVESLLHDESEGVRTYAAEIKLGQ